MKIRDADTAHPCGGWQPRWRLPSASLPCMPPLQQPRRRPRASLSDLRPVARSRTSTPCSESCPISSRSANDKYLPDMGLDMNSGMPPLCRNQRVPTACDTPTASAAFSLVIPVAICAQNRRSVSRRCDGAPGKRIASRPVNFCIHPAGRPINTSLIKGVATTS